jgi:hypothetical protein
VNQRRELISIGRPMWTTRGRCNQQILSANCKQGNMVRIWSNFGACLQSITCHLRLKSLRTAHVSTWYTEQTGSGIGAMMATPVIYRDQDVINDTDDRRIHTDLFGMPIAVTSTARAVRIYEAYKTRSNRNIGAWREFLPDDCVTAMIRMGWDRTT